MSSGDKKGGGVSLVAVLFCPGETFQERGSALTSCAFRQQNAVNHEIWEIHQGIWALFLVRCCDRTSAWPGAVWRCIDWASML